MLSLQENETYTEPRHTYLNSLQVRRRYGVSDMSLWRWLRDKDLGFPQPLRIHKRRFWKLAELEAWEATRASKQLEDA